MKIKIHSSELNRMMKTMTQCIDSRSQNYSNVSIIYDNNFLSIRGTNGSFSAVMSTPVLGGDGESFCVDGNMFARVCSMCRGDVEISTDDKVCTIKGAGRTRLPIVTAKVPAFSHVNGKECKVKAEAFSKGYNSVSYAVSDDQGRIVLTGVLMESDGDGMRMIALDGFKMAMEPVPCETDEIRMIVPGAFVKLISGSTIAGETITLRTDGKRLQASTDGMMLACTLLQGDYPDHKRILPTEFKTGTKVYADQMLSALKSGSVVNQSNNLVKLAVGDTKLYVMSNSEQADFEANVECLTTGDPIEIAFNHKFLMESIGSIAANEIVMRFGTKITPCVIHAKDCEGWRLLLPVRTAG